MTDLTHLPEDVREALFALETDADFHNDKDFMFRQLRDYILRVTAERDDAVFCADYESAEQMDALHSRIANQRESIVNLFASRAELAEKVQKYRARLELDKHTEYKIKG